MSVQIIDLSDDDDDVDLPSLKSLAPIGLGQPIRHPQSQSRYSDIDSFSSSPILAEPFLRENAVAGPSTGGGRAGARGRAPPVIAAGARVGSREEGPEVPEVPERSWNGSAQASYGNPSVNVEREQTSTSGFAYSARGRGRGCVYEGARGRGGATRGYGNDLEDASGTSRQRRLRAQSAKKRLAAGDESSEDEEYSAGRAGANARKKARSGPNPPEVLRAGLAMTSVAGPSRSVSNPIPATGSGQTSGAGSLAEKFADRDKERKAKAAEQARVKEVAKQAAKLAKEREKEEKKRWAEANKLRHSKNDTVREIKVFISPDFEQKKHPFHSVLPAIREKLVSNLSELRTMTAEDAGGMQGVMRFERHVKARYDVGKKSFQPLPPGEEHWEKEDMMVLFITAKQLSSLVATDKARSAEEEGLHTWFRRVRSAFPSRHGGVGQTILLIHGLKAHYGKNTSAAAKAYEARALAAIRDEEVDGDEAESEAGDRDGGVTVSREEVEMALLRLHIAEKCFQIQVETKGDMEDWIWNIAADLAMRPVSFQMLPFWSNERLKCYRLAQFLPQQYKLIEKSHLAFSTGDLPRKGKTPQDTYRLMLEEVTGITQSAASGIAEKFPTFRSLMEGFVELERQVERGEAGHVALEDMITNAGCLVRNTTTGQENARKIGPVSLRAL